MRRFFPTHMPCDDGTIIIDGDEYFHLNKVLRVQAGEKVICAYGDGFEHLCEIISTSKTSATAKIIQSEKSDKTPKVDITLFQGMPKGDKFEFIVQKMVELGIKRIVPFESEFTVAKCQNDKTERFERIAKEACKQCGRSDDVKVENGMTFKQMIKELDNYDIAIVAYEHEENKPLTPIFNGTKKIALIVGSEGGFSKEEVDQITATKSAISVTLGKRILRAETAAVALVSVVMFLAGEWQ